MRADGLILAGGKSSRMGGRHKGGLTYRENTFVQILIWEFWKKAGKIWLSYGREHHGAYGGCEILMDIYPDCGPVSGIHAGLSACEQEWMMVAACDMPLLKIELFQYLWEELERAEHCRGMENGEGNGKEDQIYYEGAVPILHGRLQPLAAIYRKSAAGIWEEQIKKESYRLRDTLKKMNILYIDVTENAEFARMLRNVNTLEEYENLIGRE